MQPDITIIDCFLADHIVLFECLSSTVQWDDSMAARRTASYDKLYNFSLSRYTETPLLPSLLTVAEKLANQLGISFNNCLLNYYETGDNTMGFHADDISGLEPGTGVAIVSLGSVRDITYRNKANPELQCVFPLKPGSLLYMDAAVQLDWVHAIKRQKDAGPRISLTWRAFA